MTHEMTRRELVKAAALAATAAAGAAQAEEPKKDAPAKDAPAKDAPAKDASAKDGAKPVGVAILGCGHIHTPGYVQLIKSRPDVKLKWVWDLKGERAKALAESAGAKWADDHDDIHGDPEVQAVIICSQTNQHVDLVMGSAYAKKHLFVEKPLGITAGDCQVMVDGIRKAGVLFNTGYFNRTLPVHLFLKDEIAKGHFGRITRVFGSTCHAGSLEGLFDKEWRWMADPQVAGFGAFGDLGTHSLDLLMWLIGDVEAATADVRVVTKRYGECDESGQGLLRFKNGASGVVAAGWVDVNDPVTLMISGTEAHAVVVRGQLHYTCKKVPGADGARPYRDLPKAQPRPLDMFLDAVVQGRKDLPLVTPQEAASRVAVMEAMYKAAREKTWVTIG